MNKQNEDINELGPFAVVCDDDGKKKIYGPFYTYAQAEKDSKDRVKWGYKNVKIAKHPCVQWFVGYKQPAPVYFVATYDRNEAVSEAKRLTESKGKQHFVYRKQFIKKPTEPFNYFFGLEG